MAEYCHNNCSKCPPLPTHTCAKTSTLFVNCTVNDGLVIGQCHAKRAENAASVHNTYLDKIVCYLQRLFIRDRKLKHQVSKLSALKLGVCSKMNAYYIFVCIFVQIRQKSNFQLSQGSAATYRRYSGKCYMDFVGNLLLFPAVKEF